MDSLQSVCLKPNTPQEVRKCWAVIHRVGLLNRFSNGFHPSHYPSFRLSDKGQTACDGWNVSKTTKHTNPTYWLFPNVSGFQII